MYLTSSLILLFFPSLLFFQSSLYYFRRLFLLLLIFALIDSFNWSMSLPETNILFWDGQILINEYSLILTNLLLIFAFFIILSFHFQSTVLYTYLLTNLLGLILLIHSQDFLILLLSWEIINISTYLIVTSHSSFFAAGLKYFFLSALNTSLLLIGILLIYADLGNLNINNLVFLTHIYPLFFIYLALFFKLSAFPFYLWAPDLYNKMSYSINSWLMILPKMSFGFLLNSLMVDHLFFSHFLLICGLFSILIGSISLNTQYLMKRFIAYSSISHIGYILLTFNNTSILLLTLFIYSLTLFGLLFILTHYNIHTIQDCHNVYINNPTLGLSLGLLFFSFTGIPPLLGFYSKLYIILNLSNIYSSLVLILILIIIISSVISSLRYLFIIKNITFDYKNNILIKDWNYSQNWLISCILIFIITGALLIG